MKKILALALAVVFMFALAIPAFADDLTPAAPNATNNLAPSSDDVLVTYSSPVPQPGSPAPKHKQLPLS